MGFSATAIKLDFVTPGDLLRTPSPEPVGQIG
jgi:hypothetical protein